MLQNDDLLHGRYRIQRKIGKGGMGQVYKASDERLKTAVAVKEALVSDTRLLFAFEEEALRLARLRHPGLPNVIDHFVEGNGHYLVMEYIEGDDLRQRLRDKKGPFEVAEVLEWADQLLGILEYLHAQMPPVIHRDIKPHNLKLMPDGTLILLDFGLSKGGLAFDARSDSSVDAYTRGYAPLEQIKGTGTEARSDLYAVGTTLWKLLTNRPLIDAEIREEAAIQQVPDPLPPANELNRNVPASMAQIISHALALNLNERPLSATQMRAMLGAELERQQRDSPWNPLHHLRLLWSLLMAPQELQSLSGRQTGNWLISTLAWLPLILLTFALGMEILPRSNQTIAASIYVWMSIGGLLAWLVTALFADWGKNKARFLVILALASLMSGVVAEVLSAVVAGKVAVGVALVLGSILAASMAGSVAKKESQKIALFTAFGAVFGMVFGALLGITGGPVGWVAVIVTLALTAALLIIDSLETEGGAAAVMLLLLVGLIGLGVAQVVGLVLTESVPFGMIEGAGAVVLAIVALVVAFEMQVGVDRVVEESIRTGNPSWLVRGAFGALVAAYVLLLWFSFFAG